MDEEFRFHVEACAEDLVRNGVSQQEAIRRARVAFGGVQQTKEEALSLLGVGFVSSVIQDIRFGTRIMRKSWGLTLVLTITLALGIGVNTAIFSVLNGWLLRPLPVRMPEEIVVIASQQKEKNDSQYSFPELLDIRNQSDKFSDVFAYSLGVGGLSVDGRADEFAYSNVTGNYFSALAVKPVLGRLFVQGEGEKPGDEMLIVLGFSYWQRKFGGNSEILNKPARVNGKSARIIGVASQGFHGTLFAFDMDGYLLVSAIPQDADSVTFWNDRNARRLNLLGRLKPGVSIAEAQSSMDVVAARLSAQFPLSNQGLSSRVIPERMARPAPLVSSFVPAIAGLFLFLSGLVLSLACLNVTNILFARATARQREIAIRAALGAGRARLLRQLLVESLLLALLATCAGVALGEWAMRAAGSLLGSVTSTSNFAYKLDCSFDWRVFGYTLGTGLFTAVFVGALPALRAGRRDVGSALHEGHGNSSGAGGHKIRRILVVVQIAGSLTLLIVAGLFVRSLQRAESMDLGFDPGHVLNVMLDPAQIDYDESQTKRLYRELKEHVGGMPGIESVSLAYAAPLQYPGHASFIYPEGSPAAASEHPPTISYNSIDPDYFKVMRVPLLRGRPFSDTDNEMARPVAIVNKAMAKKLWPREEAVAKRFSLKGPAGPFIEVVGISGNGQYFFLSPDPQPYFYLPLAQSYTSFQSLQVRSSGASSQITRQIHDQIRSIAPDLPIIDVSTMEHIVQGLAGFFVFRLAAALAAGMGLLGLILALVGIYGVVSFAVGQRTREIGIRVALGGKSSQILKLFVGHGMRLAIGGVISGMILALVATRIVTKLLIGIAATDPATYLAAVTLLLVTTLLACWIPARRATRVDSMVALRYE